MLEVLALGLALERLHGGLVEPVGEEDAAVRGRQLVRLPFLEVVLVVKPLIEQLPEVDFDLAPHAAINRLHLVGLVGRHLVVVDANRLYQRRDLGECVSRARCGGGGSRGGRGGDGGGGGVVLGCGCSPALARACRPARLRRLPAGAPAARRGFLDFRGNRLVGFLNATFS